MVPLGDQAFIFIDWHTRIVLQIYFAINGDVVQIAPELSRLVFLAAQIDEVGSYVQFGLRKGIEKMDSEIAQFNHPSITDNVVRRYLNILFCWKMECEDPLAAFDGFDPCLEPLPAVNDDFPVYPKGLILHDLAPRTEKGDTKYYSGFLATEIQFPHAWQGLSQFRLFLSGVYCRWED